MSDVNDNNMGPVGEPSDADREVFEAVKHQVINKVHEIHHADHVHHLHETDKLKHISAYKLVLVAKEEVAYGVNYFGKVHLGDDKYVHARAHKSHEGVIDFYSLHTTRDCAIWTLNDPLVYFNE